MEGAAVDKDIIANVAATEGSKSSERTCKPGSVPRRIDRREGNHFSRTAIARRLERPTRELVAGRNDPRGACAPTSLCLALLPAGFA